MVKSIGIIGDSVAHGYGDAEDLGYFVRLGKKMLANNPAGYVFNNMSQAGDNVADAFHRAVTEAISREFDLILVDIGNNDLRRRKDSALQLDLSEGVRRMYWNKLLDVLTLTKAKIVVLGLIPIVAERYTEQATLIRDNADFERYNAIIKEICAERGISLFERYDLWKNRDLEKLYHDATHPNAAGHQLIADEIYNYLQGQGLL